MYKLLQRHAKCVYLYINVVLKIDWMWQYHVYLINSVANQTHH